MTLQISVIIPVYNAAKYVTQAVESALVQPETAEVLLVEDGSQDNSLEVCQILEKKYSKVKLLMHPNGENRGAGASRNLGMKSAKCDLISFLDADDYYLSERFNKTMRIFKANPACEGVYEAIGMHVDGKNGIDRWNNAGKTEQILHTMRKSVEPAKLAEALMSNQYGSFSINGLVIKKSVLSKTGFMRENLKLHQDTDFIIRVAVTSHLCPGELWTPVAMWRVHEQNRISAPRSQIQKLDDRLAMWQSLYSWCRKNHYDRYLPRIMRSILHNVISSKRFKVQVEGNLSRKSLRVKQLLIWLVMFPNYFFDRHMWATLFKIL